MFSVTDFAGPPSSSHFVRRWSVRFMSETYRHVADEQLICGAQMHVDVPDRDCPVRALCVINPGLPPLPALSASSPYWLGADTGHASRRSVIWQRRPTCGPRSTN
ncbi:glutamate-cysteine ligase family protein [Streptomyces sp. NBC_00250]|uniref:glutamate-cysteine ligase family protein n=1 Tax=Streptomyces sp. NBC_00250 TaxID=2903641 RepID=UPI003FA76AEA